MSNIVYLQGNSSKKTYDFESLFSQKKFVLTECNLLEEFEHKLLHSKIDGIMFDQEHLPDLLHSQNLVHILTSSTIPICSVQTNENDTSTYDSNPIKLSYIFRTYKSPKELQQDVYCFCEVVNNASSRNKFQHSSTERDEYSTWLDQKDLLQSLANHVPGMLFHFVRYPDGTMNCPYVSKGIEKLFEIYEYNLPIELDFMLSRIHPEDKESFIESINLSFHNHSFWENTHRVVLPNQGIRWIRASSQPQKFPDGTILWHGYAYDTTESKQLEIQLNETNYKFDNLANHLPGMLFQFVRYPDGTMMCPYVSKGIESVFEIFDYVNGVSFENFVDRIHPEDFDGFVKSIEQSTEKVSFWQYTFRVVLPKKGVHWIKASSRPQKFQDGKIIWHGYAYDTTVSKQLEIQLDDTNYKFHNLANFLPGMLFQFVVYPDREMICTYSSRAIESLFEIFDYSNGVPFENFVSRIHPADLEGYLESIKFAIQNLIFWEYTYRVILPKKGIRWIAASANPQKMSDGKIIAHGYAYDVTDRKKAEAAMLRNQRIESIGTLAGGIAHDLNNILTPILTSAEILKLKINDEKLLKVLNLIEVSSKRGADMVQQVLAFSKGQSGKKEPINISYVFNEVSQLVSVSFPKNIELTTIFDDNLPLIVGDYTQLVQVFINICINARDAMPNGGSIIIHCKKFDVNNDLEFIDLGLKKGVYLQINITDTGSGMTQEVQERLFEPYFTTKESGLGTGLGMPTSLSIITAHNGVIHVYSKLDKGTNFQIYLPSTNIEQVLDEIPSIAEYNAQGEHVIVVDEEDTIRTFTKRALETIGFNVDEVTNGKDAVEKLVHDEPVAILIITDLLLPKDEAVSTIIEAKRLNPSVKIIAISYLIDSADSLLDFPDIIYLQKPFSTSQLLKSVVSLLKK